MRRIALFLLIVFCCFRSAAQIGSDSCSMEISLLTCAPGTDTYSIFGHTAIRIRDSLRGMDVVYNYGTFDDTDPLFYAHFTRGIMLYSLSAESFSDFMQEYQYEQRAVTAQILNLNCNEKNRLYEGLRKNAADENRFYQYHFHTDNCTTRAGRIIENSVGPAFHYRRIISDPGPAFRDMIHEYIERQHQDWSGFGIDMLLGSHLDIRAGNEGAIHFLPDYLFKGMDSAMNGNKPMIAKKKILLSFPDTRASSLLITPILFFSFLLILGVFLFFLKNSKPLLVFDIIYFSLLGLFGLLISYLWLGRVDDVCRNNINILWALPTHIVAVFFIRKKATWIKYYFLATAVVAGILLIGFPWWFQRMNTAVIPILITILFRAVHLFLKRNHAEKTTV